MPKKLTQVERRQGSVGPQKTRVVTTSEATTPKIIFTKTSENIHATPAFQNT